MSLSNICKCNVLTISKKYIILDKEEFGVCFSKCPDI